MPIAPAGGVKEFFWHSFPYENPNRRKFINLRMVQSQNISPRVIEVIQPQWRSRG